GPRQQSPRRAPPRELEAPAIGLIAGVAYTGVLFRMINDLDRLRRLESEIGPSADALNRTGHRGVLQVALPTAIVAALFAIARVAWPQRQMTDAEVPQTVGHAGTELTTED